MELVGSLMEMEKTRRSWEDWMSRNHDAFRSTPHATTTTSISACSSAILFFHHLSHHTSRQKKRTYLFLCEVSEAIEYLFASQAKYCRSPRRMLTGGVQCATETSTCIPDASTDTKSDDDALQAQAHEIHDA